MPSGEENFSDLGDDVEPSSLKIKDEWDWRNFCRWPFLLSGDTIMTAIRIQQIKIPASIVRSILKLIVWRRRQGIQEYNGISKNYMNVTFSLKKGGETLCVLILWNAFIEYVCRSYQFMFLCSSILVEGDDI